MFVNKLAFIVPPLRMLFTGKPNKNPPLLLCFFQQDSFCNAGNGAVIIGNSKDGLYYELVTAPKSGANNINYKVTHDYDRFVIIKRYQ